MKIVNIKGGLGNQMFQYAFACKLRKNQPSETLLFDLKDFKGYKWHNYELKDVFGIDLPIASWRELIRVTSPFSANTFIGKVFRRTFKLLGLRRKEYIEKGQFVYHEDALQIRNSCYFDGYWACPYYFEDIREDILKTFSFNLELNDNNNKLLGSIKDNNSISIHVRRGNYLLFDIYKGICDIDYYRTAISIIKERVEKPHFFVFSNDIEWCKENLTPLMNDFTFVEGNDENNNYIDMQLMTNCKHNIIANSTFSWWGAWLNLREDKIVICPSKWLNNYNTNPCPKTWIAI